MVLPSINAPVPFFLWSQPRSKAVSEKSEKRVVFTSSQFWFISLFVWMPAETKPTKLCGCGRVTTVWTFILSGHHVSFIRCYCTHLSLVPTLNETRMCSLIYLLVGSLAIVYEWCQGKSVWYEIQYPIQGAKWWKEPTAANTCILRVPIPEVPGRFGWKTMHNLWADMALNRYLYDCL